MMWMWLLPALGFGLIALGVVMMARRRRARRRAAPSTSRQNRRVRSDQDREARMKRELEDLAVQIHDMSRDAEAAAQNRTAMLEKAIRDADQRHADLKATLAQLNEKLQSSREER